MDDILALIENAPETRQRDARALLDLMARATGEQPYLWNSIVSFGSYHYIYATGREGDAPAAGFSPRKAATTIYLADGVDAHADDLARLGPHTLGKGCLYLKDLAKVDLDVLEQIVRDAYRAASTPGFAQHGAGQ
ncbi:MAG: DUF1801 domain-containing protein [Salinibacterium sp.]|nr:DUF1801 domain-containing protein [Salinibacterium sp.]MBF0671734.1 DUF1801 domain-containing protein [Salinibacterium sp.]